MPLALSRLVITKIFCHMYFLGLFVIFLLNLPPAFAHGSHEIFGPPSPFLDLVDRLSLSPLKSPNPTQGNQSKQIPGFLSFKQSLDSNRHGFFEFSGELEEDDPTDGFISYLHNPLNWDPSGETERTFTYGSHLGLTHSGRVLGGASTIRFGLQSRLENVQVQNLTSQGRTSLTTGQPSDLINVTYAPYLTLESTPFSWLRLTGDLRADVTHSAVQNICGTNCPAEPEGPRNEFVPSVKGNLIVKPWANTELYLNVGSGFYSHEERELIGSTESEQLSRSTAYELGIRTRAGDNVELMASLWGADHDFNFMFFGDGEPIEEGACDETVWNNF